MFPSSGLTLYQIAEAIKALNLSPVIVEGNLSIPGQDNPAFDKARFCATDVTPVLAAV